MNDYERGFSAGIRCVASILRNAAGRVGTDRRKTFTNQAGATYDAIARISDIPFAVRLRGVADILDDVAKDVTEISKESAKT